MTVAKHHVSASRDEGARCRVSDARHDRQGRRARLLDSIFSHQRRAAPLSGALQQQADPRPAQRPGPQGWRDVTAALFRGDIAQRLCSRFFCEPPHDVRDSCAGRLDGGMVTAGQRMQALSDQRLSGQPDSAEAASLLRAAACEGQAAAEQNVQSAGATLQSLLTVRAA